MSMLVKYQAAIAARVPTIGCYKDLDLIQRINLNTLAMLGEAGELANKLKKYQWYETSSDLGLNALRVELVDELGDVFYHAFQLATELGIAVEDVLEYSLEKSAAKAKLHTH